MITVLPEQGEVAVVEMPGLPQPMLEVLEQQIVAEEEEAPTARAARERAAS